GHRVVTLLGLLSMACGRLDFDATVDATVQGDTAPACPHMACENFEDPRSAWTVLTESGSTVERSDTFGYRGASLRAEAPPGSTLAARLFSVFPQNPPAE